MNFPWPSLLKRLMRRCKIYKRFLANSYKLTVNKSLPAERYPAVGEKKNQLVHPLIKSFPAIYLGQQQFSFSLEIFPLSTLYISRVEWAFPVLGKKERYTRRRKDTMCTSFWRKSPLAAPHRVRVCGLSSEDTHFRAYTKWKERTKPDSIDLVQFLPVIYI